MNHRSRSSSRRNLQGMHEMFSGALGGLINVVMKLGANLWPVEVDSGEMELAILNLCLNARDAMPEGGTITITAENVEEGESGHARDFVKLAVTDSVFGPRHYRQHGGNSNDCHGDVSSDHTAHLQSPTRKPIDKRAALDWTTLDEARAVVRHHDAWRRQRRLARPRNQAPSPNTDCPGHWLRRGGRGDQGRRIQSAAETVLRRSTGRCVGGRIKASQLNLGEFADLAAGTVSECRARSLCDQVRAADITQSS